MKMSLLILAATGLLLVGCDNNKSGNTPQGTNAAKATPNYNTGNPVTAPVDYLGTVVQAQKNMTKSIDTSYLNEAIQTFQVQEGRLPKDLNELVPNYVGKLPQVPYGMKLDYNPATGQVKVVKE